MPTKAEIDVLRPAIHGHVTLLTAAGVAPSDALAIAAESAVLCYSALCDEALAMAVGAIGVELCGIPAETDD